MPFTRIFVLVGRSAGYGAAIPEGLEPALVDGFDLSQGGRLENWSFASGIAAAAFLEEHAR